MTETICPIMSFRKIHASYAEGGKHQLVPCSEKCAWYCGDLEACAIWSIWLVLDSSVGK